MFFLLLLAVPFLFLTLVIGLYVSFLKSKRHWREKNVKYKEPKFLVGNFEEAGKKNLGIIFRELYEESKSEKLYGVWQFTVPVLLINDLEMVKRVLVADFSHFDDHGVYFDEKTDPLAVNLLTIGGSAWKNLRGKLNPAFTAGKLKMLLPMILKCGEELKEVLQGAADRGAVVEFKDLFARFTTDVISSCAFGIETNSLADEEAEFRVMGRRVFESSYEVLWRNFVGFLFPDFARFFKIRIYPKEVTRFFVGAIRETMELRESKGVRRNDILQMLIQLKNEGFIRDSEAKNKEENLTPKEQEDKFTYEQAAAQAFIFFTAGFETSSTTMQYALYEMAINPQIQDKVRQEIKNTLAQNEGKLTYETLHKMEYLGRVVDETLRKYPPATNLSRICTKPYKIPGTNTTLEKGTQVSVSVLGIQRDERYYPDPERFDPDRFLEEEKASRPAYTYMPFGEGPRTCIGQRFGLAQTKVGLITIISNYKISISEDTQIPPIYDPKSFFSAPKGGMHLRITNLPD